MDTPCVSLHLAHRACSLFSRPSSASRLSVGGRPFCQFRTLRREKHCGDPLLFYEAPNKNVADALINDRSQRLHWLSAMSHSSSAPAFRYGSSRRRLGTARIRVTSHRYCSVRKPTGLTLYNTAKFSTLRTGSPCQRI